MVAATDSSRLVQGVQLITLLLLLYLLWYSV